MAGWRIVVVAGIGVCLLVGVWFAYRANKFGINNVFSREHVFSISEALNEEIAITVTRRALRAGGYDVSDLTPVGRDRGDGNVERFHASARPNTSSGYVLWGRTPDGSPDDEGYTWRYLVRLEKHGSEIRCRVFVPK